MHSSINLLIPTSWPWLARTAYPIRSSGKANPGRTELHSARRYWRWHGQEESLLQRSKRWWRLARRKPPSRSSRVRQIAWVSRSMMQHWDYITYKGKLGNCEASNSTYFHVIDVHLPATSQLAKDRVTAHGRHMKTKASATATSRLENACRQPAMDLLTNLPIEMQLAILRLLDVPDILAARQVSILCESTLFEY